MKNEIPKAPLNVEWVPIERVVENPHNARIHTPAQIEKIAASIKANGFTQPILTNDCYNVISGHGRLAGGRNAGLSAVPVIRLGHLTRAQARAYGIADNKLTDESYFDKKLLSFEFELVRQEDPEFDLELTGFSDSEVELILDIGSTVATDQPPQLPAISSGPAVTRAGDRWTIGDHALLCADADEPASYKNLLGSTVARPPATSRHPNGPCARERRSKFGSRDP